MAADADDDGRRDRGLPGPRPGLDPRRAPGPAHGRMGVLPGRGGRRSCSSDCASHPMSPRSRTTTGSRQPGSFQTPLLSGMAAIIGVVLLASLAGSSLGDILTPASNPRSRGGRWPPPSRERTATTESRLAAVDAAAFARGDGFGEPRAAHPRRPVDDSTLSNAFSLATLPRWVSSSPWPSALTPEPRAAAARRHRKQCQEGAARDRPTAGRDPRPPSRAGRGGSDR